MSSAASRTDDEDEDDDTIHARNPAQPLPQQPPPWPVEAALSRSSIARDSPSIASSASAPRPTTAETIPPNVLSGQALGRRRRDRESSSPAPADSHDHARKRQRLDGIRDDRDVDMEASNGTSRSQHRNGAAATTTNGTSGKAALNGSSQKEVGPAFTTSEYFGHNREEVTRLLIQTLSDMGYQQVAENLSEQSGYELESPTVAAFREAVGAGTWSEAEDLLSGAAVLTEHGRHSQPGNGLVLAADSDINLMRFWIREQKFLELLERGETTKALLVLRSELEPLKLNKRKLHFLSSLLMCETTDLLSKAQWDGANGQSRQVLLSELSRCISPSVMLPEHRMAVLLQQVKRNQIDNCLYHTMAVPPSLYSDHSCDRSYFPTEVALSLTDVGGEVWGLQFSHDGRHLAAWGRSETVVIWDVRSFNAILILNDHGAEVANAAWSPNDTMIVTCGQDHRARLWDVKTGRMLKMLEVAEEPVSGCVWAPDGQSFTTSSLDKTRGLRTWNLEGELICDWNKRQRVQDVCGDERWLVAVDDAHTIHVYDAVTRELVCDLSETSRPMSVSLSEDSRHLLVNRKDGEARLIDLTTRETIHRYKGHKGGEYLIRSSLGGANESFVVSGSDDGSLFIWHKNTGSVVEQLEGHRPRTNAVVWNPQDNCMLASCGDDGQVKIWSNKEQAAFIRQEYQT